MKKALTRTVNAFMAKSETDRNGKKGANHNI